MKKIKIITLLISLIVIGLFLTGCSTTKNFHSLKNISKNLVDPSELVSGGPPEDGIPSIDNPEFLSIEESIWIDDSAEVFVLVVNDTVKVYPQSILVWHEIVNDELAGTPIAITYCPLCGSSVAYKRIINGTSVEFGTTGLLYNSNLVLYDRTTGSYWTQIRGQAIIGDLAGEMLEKIPLQTMAWRDVKNRFKSARVLSRKTGYSRSYGNDPYSDYYEREEILFPVKNIDSKYELNTKTIVIGITVNNEPKAYTEFDLLTAENITDRVGGNSLFFKMEKDGFLTIENIDTGEMIPWERDFWFAWFAFHPETTLYSK